MPQDTVLFNDSLLHNLRYGRADASVEEVLEAATCARLDGTLALMPDGVDTMVGERGVKLRRVLYTASHTTASAWCTSILKDFSRRISPPGRVPRFQSRRASTPHNSASDAFHRHPDVASYGTALRRAPKFYAKHFEVMSFHTLLATTTATFPSSLAPAWMIEVGRLTFQARSPSHWSPYDRVGVVNADL